MERASEVQLKPLNGSQADYGVYFRNQPGNQQGVYTFFIHSISMLLGILISFALPSWF